MIIEAELFKMLNLAWEIRSHVLRNSYHFQPIPMLQVLLGSLILSVIHALIPNHWIPVIAIAKTEKWTSRETLSATFLTGFSHTASTILIGILVGFAGIKLSENYHYIARVAAPVILVSIGIIYSLVDLKSSHHHHHHHPSPFSTSVNRKKSKPAIIASLSIGMFLTPCIEIEAYYFQAATIGWPGIFIVSLVYLTITLVIMFVLVYLGLKGINRFNSHYLEHHEKRITGIVLILLGLFANFAEF
jgi:nickel/cobalt transporter (NicO) family protein